MKIKYLSLKDNHWFFCPSCMYNLISYSFLVLFNNVKVKVKGSKIFGRIRIKFVTFGINNNMFLSLDTLIMRSMCLFVNLLLEFILPSPCRHTTTRFLYLVPSEMFYSQFLKLSHCYVYNVI